jgi:hypothetical protein
MRDKTLPVWAAVLLLFAMSCSLVSAPLQATPTSQNLPASATPIQPVATGGPSTPVQPAASEQPAATEQPAAQATLPPLPADVYPPAFASYSVPAAAIPAQFQGSYSLPLELSQVKGLDQVQLSQQQLDLLKQNGFAVAAPVAGKYREFYQVYESLRYDQQPVFATTDAVFHVYHLVFDKMLRDLERDYFISDLEKLSSAMLAASQAQYQALQGTSLEEPARRNLAFFAVATQLLGLPDPVPAPVQDLVSAELKLIDAHQGVALSPIWDRPDLPNDKKLIEDYSQYVPRGHYTLSDNLKHYFKAMIWYGRLTYRLRDNFETQRALLVVQALRSASAADGTSAVELWQNIYEPTTFIVGKADDLSYFEYGALSDQVFGKGAAPQAFGDETRLAQFVELARKLPPPQVNSMWVWITEDKTEATQGFRFMGQRFTLDQYVFGQLIWRNVGTSDKQRGLPKALDFFAAMGSDEALNLLKGMGEDQYQNYDSQMSKVRQEISGLQIDSWTQNLYWAWLYAFQPVIEPKNQAYPAFMQTEAWTRKDLQTALSSWTELKHDTILYAKQVMAEMGGGPPGTPPHGYVEPNPEAFARLLALVQMTQSGLQERNLLSETTRGNLSNLADLLTFLKKMSEMELAGQTPSDDDYWRLQYIGGALEALTLAASDCGEGDPAGCRNLNDIKSPLVADVATGLAPDGSLLALEEGVGQPTEIYVVLPDQPYRLAVGAVYTYYEFAVTPDQRMTDETWQAQVEQGSNPPAPDWTSAFIAP